MGTKPSGIGRVALLVILAALGALPFIAKAANAEERPARLTDFKPTLTAAEAPAPSNGLRKVVTGVYVTRIDSVELSSNQFTVEFWIWFRWKGEEYDPVKSFEVVGGNAQKSDNVQRKKIGDESYASLKVNATIKCLFELKRFPLDDHTLSINIEDTDNEDDKIVFVPDQQNSSVDPLVQVPGWNLDSASSSVAAHGYKSNYGDTSLATGNESSYSRFTYDINLVRPGLGYLFKLFWSIYLAVIIGFLALLIKPTDLDPRFGLGVGAIFAAAASAYTVNSALPPTNLMTLSDKVNMISIGFIFISLLESIISLRFCYVDKTATSQKLDKIGFIALMAAYALANLVAVMTA